MTHAYPVAVASIVARAVTLLATQVGLPFAVIVGGSGIVAFVVWLFTTYRYPVDGRRILPLYVLAVGMQYVHMTEEFLADFAGHFSALTGASPFRISRRLRFLRAERSCRRRHRPNRTRPDRPPPPRANPARLSAGR